MRKKVKKKGSQSAQLLSPEQSVVNKLFLKVASARSQRVPGQVISLLMYLSGCLY